MIKLIILLIIFVAAALIHFVLLQVTKDERKDELKSKPI